MSTEQQQLEAAIAALDTQRATLGDSVLELATAPLRARRYEPSYPHDVILH